MQNCSSGLWAEPGPSVGQDSAHPGRIPKLPGLPMLGKCSQPCIQALAGQEVCCFGSTRGFVIYFSHMLKLGNNFAPFGLHLFLRIRRISVSIPFLTGLLRALVPIGTTLLVPRSLSPASVPIGTTLLVPAWPGPCSANRQQIDSNRYASDRVLTSQLTTPLDRAQKKNFGPSCFG